MTATQPDSDRGITRRGVMRGAAIGIGATAAGGVGTKYVGSPVGNAEAVAPLALLAAGAGLVSAGAAIVAYGESISGPDDSEVADALEWQAHVDEFTRAREDELMLDQTLASLERDVQLVENKAREEAIFRIYEQAVDSGSEADATNAAESAISEAYATVEKGILDSWTLRANRAASIALMLEDGSTGQYYTRVTGLRVEQSDNESEAPNGGPSVGDFDNLTTTLLDGSEYGYFGWENIDDFRISFDPPNWKQDDQDSGVQDDFSDKLLIVEPDPANFDSQDEPLDVEYSKVMLLNTQVWYDLLDDLETRRDNLHDEVPDMIDSYYQAAADGEIDLTDIQGPAYLTDAAENAENYGEAALALNAMGFSLATEASILSVEVDGETSEFTGKLARTVDDPSPLPVGSEIVPSEVTGSIYAALNQENDDGETSGAIVEITEPFVIEEAEDGSEEIAFENRELAEADSLTNEEIQDLFAENYQSREDARDTVYETATGGGGGILSGSSDAQTLGIVAGGAALAALLLGNN